MKKTLFIVMALGFASGCDKKEQTPVAPAPQQQSVSTPAQQSTQNTTPTPLPAVDAKALDEQKYRAAADDMFNEWRGGTAPKGLWATDLIDRNKLLSYEIVGFRRKEFTGDHGESEFDYSGNVNLKVQMPDGVQERQYKMTVTENEGKWNVIMAY